ncbi:MAG: septum formation initiator family protein [Alysiella sp.]|uniref:FtsB family cell division protein n=1 Tax=Alysiella sp. TaxID=1872483 RepID=UPI0026DD1F5E|nr:septum formation initiator family protein [Alysiella sp.]MDO4433853.1 septum formation initiator family protein [Alysiella sp.]
MKWITLILSLIFISLHYQIWLPETGLRAQYAKIEKLAHTTSQQNHLLRQKNALLKAEVEDLKNGFQAVSEIARYKMGYIQEGEVLYQFKD